MANSIISILELFFINVSLLFMATFVRIQSNVGGGFFK